MPFEKEPKTSQVYDKAVKFLFTPYFLLGYLRGILSVLIKLPSKIYFLTKKKKSFVRNILRAVRTELMGYTHVPTLGENKTERKPGIVVLH